MRSPRHPSLVLTVILACGGLGATACTNQASTEPGDHPADAGAPNALGFGQRLADLNPPDSGLVLSDGEAPVTVSGATYLTTDTYSETGSSADVGAVYVQDFYSGDAGAPPYSGIELYKPILVPSSMQLAPGDVIDLTGTYDLYRYSGWSAGEYQPEVNSPDVTFRFDYRAPAPTVIPVSDLENYSTGFKWMSMLVTVVDTVGGKLTEDGQGRCGVYLTGDVGQTAVTMANELYALNCYDPKYGGTKSTAQSSVHFKSVTGIVTFFFNFSIAPRSDADIVLAD